MSLPDDDKQTTDPAATAEINNCRRRRVDAAMRRVFFMLYKTSYGIESANIAFLSLSEQRGGTCVSDVEGSLRTGFRGNPLESLCLISNYPLLPSKLPRKSATLAAS